MNSITSPLRYERSYRESSQVVKNINQQHSQKKKCIFPTKIRIVSSLLKI